MSEEQDGSFYQVPVTDILKVEKHPNADRLSIYTVFGFQVIGGLDQYKVGDMVAYIPVDSIIQNPDLEMHLFPPDSKVKLTKCRVRQIRLRKVASQGMLINPESLVKAGFIKNYKLGQDLSEELKITKYEPPTKQINSIGKNGQPKKKKDHPQFIKYNGINNIKWFPMYFEEGEQVVYQEKLHGSLARFSVLPFVADTLWKKIKKLLGLAPKIEKLYGSNRVQISRKFNFKGYYGEDHWGQCAKKYNVFSKIKLGEVVFCELIGPGIQANYNYGLTDHAIVLYDVCKIDNEGKKTWLTPEEVEDYAKERGFEMVPVLYKGPHDPDKAYRMTFGPSVYDSKQKVREGIVVKARGKEYTKIDGSRRSLKAISEDYLADKTNTDNH